MCLTGSIQVRGFVIKTILEQFPDCFRKSIFYAETLQILVIMLDGTPCITLILHINLLTRHLRLRHIQKTDLTMLSR